MPGASAEASSSQRRIGKVSKPVQLNSPLPHSHAPCSARSGVSVSENQGRNRMLTTSRIAATPPTIVLR